MGLHSAHTCEHVCIAASLSLLSILKPCSALPKLQAGELVFYYYIYAHTSTIHLNIH